MGIIRAIGPSSYRVTAGARGGNSSGLDAWPINSVYISFDSINPSEKFGGGTWELLEEGYFLKAAKTSLGQTEGSTESGGTALTVQQLASHTHTFTGTALATHTHAFTGTSATTSSAGAHTHPIKGSTGSPGYYETTMFGGSVTAGSNRMVTDSSGAHTHTLTATGTNAAVTAGTPSGTNSATGSGQAHSHTINAPGIRLAMWKRTA